MENAKINFTTKSMVSGGVPIKVVYSMEGDVITIRGKEEENKDLFFQLSPSHEWYEKALAAYQAKQEKREKAAQAPREVPDKLFKGTSLKGPGFEIFMDGSIDRATVTFKRKPSAQVRELVKQAGFYWTPSYGCWSRKLSCKAWRAAQELYFKLR